MKSHRVEYDMEKEGVGLRPTALVNLLQDRRIRVGPAQQESSEVPWLCSRVKIHFLNPIYTLDKAVL